MEGRVTVTQSELLAELLSAKREGEKPDGAFRTVELKRTLGWKIDNVRATLAELKQAGIIEMVMIRIMTLDDKNQPVPHYRIKDGEDVEALVEKMLGARDGT